MATWVISMSHDLPLHRHLLANCQRQMLIWSPLRWDACKHLRPYFGLVDGPWTRFLTQLMTHRIAINRCQPYSFFLNWMNCPPNILGNDPCNTCQNDSPSNTSNGCLNRSITHHYSMMTSSSLLSRDITDCVAFCILLQTLQARFLGWRLSIGTSSDLTPWRPFWMFVSRLRLFNQWLNQIWFLVRVDGL